MWKLLGDNNVKLVMEKVFFNFSLDIKPANEILSFFKMTFEIIKVDLQPGNIM